MTTLVGLHFGFFSLHFDCTKMYGIRLVYVWFLSCSSSFLFGYCSYRLVMSCFSLFSASYRLVMSCFSLFFGWLSAGLCRVLVFFSSGYRLVMSCFSLFFVWFRLFSNYSVYVGLFVCFFRFYYGIRHFQSCVIAVQEDEVTLFIHRRKLR